MALTHYWTMEERQFLLIKWKRTQWKVENVFMSQCSMEDTIHRMSEDTIHHMSDEIRYMSEVISKQSIEGEPGFS